ncbi:MAG: hypothetical protein NUV91_08380 [Candidatus Omnitrophica bacterium]|nr:hypothetical protein [Candidatus Omnitrophota bacterium]
MYHFSKFLQALGLIIIAIDFLRKFPNLMSPKVLVTGILLFICGWIIQKYLLRQ